MQDLIHKQSFMKTDFVGNSNLEYTFIALVYIKVVGMYILYIHI